MKLIQILNEGNQKARRMVGKLTTAEKEKIADIKQPSDLKSVKIVDEWTDDHLPCLGVKINGVPMGFWWLSRGSIGSFEYPESAKAKSWIIELIQDQIAIAREDGEWLESNDEM